MPLVALLSISVQFRERGARGAGQTKGRLADLQRRQPARGMWHLDCRRCASESGYDRPPTGPPKPGNRPIWVRLRGWPATPGPRWASPASVPVAARFRPWSTCSTLSAVLAGLSPGQRIRGSALSGCAACTYFTATLGWIPKSRTRQIGSAVSRASSSTRSVHNWRGRSPI